MSVNQDQMFSGSLAERRGPTAGAQLIVRPFVGAEALWNRTLTTLPGATLYHDPRWLTLLRRVYRLRLQLATVEEDGELLAACVLAQSRKSFGAARFVSLPFSDSCPPLARDANAMANLLRKMASHKTLGRGCEVRGIQAPCPWRTWDFFLNWTIDLDRPANQIDRRHGADFRRKIRRAREAGVTVEAGADASMVRRFHALQVETRSRLGLPAQPLRFFMTALEIFGPGGDLEIWIASHRGRDLAANVLVRQGACVYLKWAARRLAEPSTANHLLAHETVEQLAGRTRYVDLGRSDARNRGLGKVKRDCGARSHPLPYSFFPIVPNHVSSEALSGSRRAISSVWRRLPLPAARALGGALYGYLA